MQLPVRRNCTGIMNLQICAFLHYCCHSELFSKFLQYFSYFLKLEFSNQFPKQNKNLQITDFFILVSAGPGLKNNYNSWFWSTYLALSQTIICSFSSFIDILYFYLTTKHELLRLNNHNLLCCVDPPNQGRLFWLVGPK